MNNFYCAKSVHQYQCPRQCAVCHSNDPGDAPITPGPREGHDGMTISRGFTAKPVGGPVHQQADAGFGTAMSAEIMASAVSEFVKGSGLNAGALPMNVPGYETLSNVLLRAYNQSARGKGKERHGQGKPFDKQPMQHLIALNGPGFAAGQAGKKAQEATRMELAPAVHELLGAIVYLAGLVVYLEAEAREAA